MRFLISIATDSIYMIFEWKVTIWIYFPNNFSQLQHSMIKSLALIGTGWQEEINKWHLECFQVVETGPCKHFFCRYFKVVHDFIKCRSTFIRIGVISKIYRTIVLKKQIRNIYVKKQRPRYRSLRYIISNA